jgi:RNA recognition motif-containing protein
VREDREDRDVKQYAAEDGAARPPRPPRAPRAPRPPRERPVIEGEPSGFQICVQGIPWKYTWKELKDLFAEIGEVERADVMFAPDGRSKGWGTVRFTTTDAATEAIARFHGAQHDGRTLTVFLDKKA